MGKKTSFENMSQQEMQTLQADDKTYKTYMQVMARENKEQLLKLIKAAAAKENIDGLVLGVQYKVENAKAMDTILIHKLNFNYWYEKIKNDYSERLVNKKDRDGQITFFSVQDKDGKHYHSAKEL